MMNRIGQIAATAATIASSSIATQVKQQIDNSALNPSPSKSNDSPRHVRNDGARRALLSRMLASPQSIDTPERQRLAAAIDFFSAKPNITPTDMAVYNKAIEHDNNCLPDVIAAENSRTPGLNLKYAGTIDELKNIISQMGDENVRIVMRQPLPYQHHHYIAADIAKVDGKTSVVIVDSLEQDNQQSAWAVHLLNKSLPKDVAVTYLMTDQEKAWVGCHIFALSFASKMKDFQNELADVHAMNIRDAEDRSLPVGKEISGMHLLPGHFFKHAQSSKVVGNAIANRGENPIVNKKIRR